MTVTALPVRDEFTGSAGQTVFNYTFLIFASGDLNVFITPAGQDANDSTDITTAFTVDPGTIGNPIGGFITLNSGVSAGDLVTIVSNIPENRTVDYQNSGDFRPDTVNGDFDKVVSLVKQADENASRTLQFAQSEQNVGSISLARPAPNEFLKWNPAGDGVVSGGAPGVIIPSELGGTLVQLVAITDIQAGEFIITSGYSLDGDGGDNTYFSRAVTAGVANGGSLIKSAGNPAIEFVGLFPEGTHNSAQFGANGLGFTDDFAALVNYINFVPSGGRATVFGFVLIFTPLVITTRVSLWCETKKDAIITDVGATLDGVTYAPTGQPGLNALNINLNVYGLASSCLFGVVLDNINRSKIVLNIHTGAVDFALKFKGGLINDIYLDSSVNYQPPFPATAGFQLNHVLIERQITHNISHNANRWLVNIEGGVEGIISTDQLAQADNTITGVIEGVNGRPLDLIAWFAFSIRDIHFESNNFGPRFTSCFMGTIGPGVVSPEASNPFTFISCRQMTLDGMQGNYLFDDDCSFTKLGNIVNPEQFPTDNSYSKSEEQHGALTSALTRDRFIVSGGSSTQENLFHNPFMNIWTNGTTSAPDGAVLTNATVLQVSTPLYDKVGGFAAQVTNTGTAITDGIEFTNLAPNNVSRNDQYLSVAVPIFVATGQPDVAVYINASGAFNLIGKVTVKDEYVVVRGGARATASNLMTVKVVPRDFDLLTFVPGVFTVGGVNQCRGTLPPKDLADHGKQLGHVVTSISNTPAFIGQRALVATVLYMANGTASSANWLQISP